MSRSVSNILRSAAMLAVLAVSADASAAVISFSSNIASTTTNWAVDVNLSKFDPTLGTLTKVTWTVEGEVTAQFAAENRGKKATTALFTAEALLRLTTPGFAPLVVGLPQLTASTALAKYDGTLDFNGNSGETLAPITGTASGNTSSSDPGVLLNYIAVAGNMLLPFEAEGWWSVQGGGGNLNTSVQTFAGGTVRVDYEYTERNIVPEPASLALFAMGGFAVAYRLRRRQ